MLHLEVLEIFLCVHCCWPLLCPRLRHLGHILNYFSQGWSSLIFMDFSQRLLACWMTSKFWSSNIAVHPTFSATSRQTECMPLDLLRGYSIENNIIPWTYVTSVLLIQCFSPLNVIVSDYPLIILVYSPILMPPWNGKHECVICWAWLIANGCSDNFLSHLISVFNSKEFMECGII